MIRLALPTGDLRNETAALLDGAGCGIAGYAAGSRALRFEMPGGIARVFRERDIPVQVAMGNYDIGVCSSLHVAELAQRFPGFEVVRLRGLGFGQASLWLAAGGAIAGPSVRIVSEYANLAEAVMRRMRARRYCVFPVLGSAEAYPPEDADLALLVAPDAASVERMGLRPLAEVLKGTACIIANRRSLATKDVSGLLAGLLRAGTTPAQDALSVPAAFPLAASGSLPSREGRVRLALPDGHQQSHACASLAAGGIDIDGYDGKTFVRRPRIDVEGVDVKVIRPQDMPQQVAIGNFDVAITGRDVLFDHLVQFPTSPVEEIVDLRRSPYGLAAIVKDVPANSVAEAVEYWRRTRPGQPIRVASEFANIADHFARERHLGRYSIIPIAGASEGFVPDDAEILIEGIETGSSVRANKLTVLERFFESTNIVIANKRPPTGALRGVFDALVERLRAGAAVGVAVGGA